MAVWVTWLTAAWIGMRWLLLLHASGARDYRASERDLLRLQQQLAVGASVYVVIFGPTARSIAAAYSIRRDGSSTLDTVRLDNSHRYVPALRRLLRHVPPGSIDAVGVSAHASGWVTGPWRSKHPFLSLEQLNRELFDRYRPRLVVFDACFMGTMSSLYAISKHVRVAVASPGLHPYVSPFRLAAFAKSTSARIPATMQAMRGVARAVVAEWHHHASSDRSRCMLAFDVDRVKRLAPAIRDHWSRLRFDRRAQLHDKENVHDLWTAARDVQSLQTALDRCVLPGKPLHSNRRNARCCFPCRRVRSVSTEARIPGKWQHIYRRNAWARYMRGTRRHPPPRHSPPHPNPRIPPNIKPKPRVRLTDHSDRPQQ